jgi:hypothetical protein
MSSASTHVSSSHGKPVAGHGLGTPTHMPFMHDSLTVQNWFVLHIVPLSLGVFTQPIVMSHVPVLHTSVRKLQLVICMPTQLPPSQTPVEKHVLFIGVHAPPLFPGTPLQLFDGSSHMPTLHASTPGHILCFPMHVPIVHASLSVQ